MKELKILSLNCGIWTRNWKKSDPYYWKPRYKAIQKMIAAENPDIICLQEALFPTDWMLKPKGYRFAGFSITHPIIVRKDLDVSDHRFRIHTDECSVSLGSRIVSLVNVHSHWNREILVKDCGVINDTPYPCIACGDFNNEDSVIDPLLFALHGQARRIMNIAKEDTFVNFHNPESHGELDHIYVFYPISVSSFRIVKETYGVERLSDHYPIVATIEI